MKSHFFTEDMKVADLIHVDYKLLLLLPRLGLNLGFGDKTVKEYCLQKQVSPSFFIMICNIYSFEQYLPSANHIESTDIHQLILYLQESHVYYQNNRIQAIENQLHSISENCEQGHQKILDRFFEEYKKEVINHFEYEENIVFPYVEKIIRGEKAIGYEIDIFSENHSNIDDKLSDLKNIIIKYLPGNSMLQEKTILLFNIFSLEEDLNKHSLIEDKILIPLVQKLECHYGK